MLVLIIVVFQVNLLFFSLIVRSSLTSLASLLFTLIIPWDIISSRSDKVDRGVLIFKVMNNQSSAGLSNLHLKLANPFLYSFQHLFIFPSS